MCLDLLQRKPASPRPKQSKAFNTRLNPTRRSCKRVKKDAPPIGAKPVLSGRTSTNIIMGIKPGSSVCFSIYTSRCTGSGSPRPGRKPRYVRHDEVLPKQVDWIFSIWTSRDVARVAGLLQYLSRSLLDSPRRCRDDSRRCEVWEGT